MIGLAVEERDLPIAAEFFELFKTPWERVVGGRHYRVVVSTVGGIEDFDADVLIVFGSQEHPFDAVAGVRPEVVNGPTEVESATQRYPIYGTVATFDGETNTSSLRRHDKAIAYRRTRGTRTIWRVGYDLFGETRHLLTAGQPVAHAATPTLEHHVATLRRLLVTVGVGFVEVPPRPAGFDFSCCLTHDIDFFGIRRHRFDRTLAGFLARASIGSLVDFLRGRRPFAELVRNWAAVGSLPAVFARVAADFWRPFDDYARADAGHPSTFFLVPFKGHAGVGPDGAVRGSRAVPYGMTDIRDEAIVAAGHGNELAVHGIDAWRDADAGRAEQAALTSVTGQTRTGVRMHWLFFNQDSPQKLDAAGFEYDSTYGYNDAVGYRAGTSQVFQIPGTQLMELPLSIMDSAMFFSDRMALSREDARQHCQRILKNARDLGGTVVINWHDRSLVPERQWGQPYAELLDDVREGNRAWFGTASQVVEWFRWRRSVSFECDADGHVTVVSPESDALLPAAEIDHYRPGTTAVETCVLRPATTVRIGQ